MTGYPVIFNGDHAAFEAEHANTPPEDRPDWPLPSFDARDWARAFMKIVEKGAVVDEAWMTTWFANALMRGYDEMAAKLPANLDVRCSKRCVLKAVNANLSDADQ